MEPVNDHYCRRNLTMVLNGAQKSDSANLQVWAAVNICESSVVIGNVSSQGENFYSHSRHTATPTGIREWLACEWRSTDYMPHITVLCNSRIAIVKEA